MKYLILTLVILGCITIKAVTLDAAQTDFVFGVPAVTDDQTCPNEAYDFSYGVPTVAIDATATCAAPAGGVTNFPTVKLQVQVNLQDQIIIR